MLQPSIPLTGDSRADADIIAFYKARQKLIQKGGCVIYMVGNLTYWFGNLISAPGLKLSTWAVGIVLQPMVNSAKFGNHLFSLATLALCVICTHAPRPPTQLMLLPLQGGYATHT